MKKFITVIYCIAGLGLSLFAETKDLTLPTDNEVILVFSLDVQPRPETDFFAQYRDMDKFEYYGTDRSDQVLVSTVSRDGLTQVFWLDTDDGKNRFVAGKFKFSWGKRKLSIDSFSYMFAGVYSARIDIPVDCFIEVQKGVKFVYLGDITAYCKAPYYTMTNITKKDNFDAASLAVKKAFGDEAELERVPLIPR